MASAEAGRRRRITSDLADRESRWNYALVGSGLGVWDHNYRAGTRYYSDTWKDNPRHGAGRGGRRRLRGMADSFFIPTTAISSLRPSRGRIAGDPDYHVFEYRERHRDGHWVWIECRGACVEWNENGAPARIVGTDTDITARKEAEEMLEHLSRRLDLALEITRIGVFEADLEAGTVEWDDRLMAIYGVEGTPRIKRRRRMGAGASSGRSRARAEQP